MNPQIAYRTLCAFAEHRSRRFALVVFGSFVFPTSALAAIWAILVGNHADPKDRPFGAFMAMLFIALGTGLAWLYYPNQGLRLMRDARKLGMPSIGRDVLSAFGLLFTMTVLFPATLLAWCGDGYFAAFLGLLACSAFSGMLVTLMNVWMLGGVFVAAYAIHSILPLFPISIPLAQLVHFGQPAFGWLCMTAALFLGLLCAIRWIQMQRNDALSSLLVGSALSKVTQGRPGPRLDYAGPQDPVYAMSVWFEPPQGAQAWRRFAAYFKAFGLSVLFIGYASSRISPALFVPGLGVLFAFTVLASSGPRWRNFFLRGGGAFADLALVPGWGDARSARRVLLTAAFRPTLEFLPLAIVCVAVVAFGQEMSIAVYPIIVGVAVVIGSTSIASSLRVLANKESAPDGLLVIAMPVLMVLACASALWAHARGPFGMDTALRLDLCCLVWSAAMGWIALLAYQRFAARPHPFLMP